MRTIAILTSQLRLGPGTDWTGAGRMMGSYTRCHLEEEAEGDPLVVFVVSSLSGVVGPVHPGVGDLQPSLLPEGAGDGVGGVYPAVGVDNVLKKQTTGKKRMQF